MTRFPEIWPALPLVLRGQDPDDGPIHIDREHRVWGPCPDCGEQLVTYASHECPSSIDSRPAAGEAAVPSRQPSMPVDTCGGPGRIPEQRDGRATTPRSSA